MTGFSGTGRSAPERLSAGAKITGPGAAALKYDLLTALLVTAGQGAPADARLALRLSLVITARFNWRSGCFAVGLKELARMWGVTERTAKREMAQMRSRGWIAVEVPAARGRVARHRIELARLLQDTMPHWDAVGPDFAARMTGMPDPATDPGPSNVIPLHLRAPPVAEVGSDWAGIAAQLSDRDSAVYAAWFAPLRYAGTQGTALVLEAPSRFHADYINAHYRTRLLAALATVNPELRDVIVRAGG